MAGAAKVVANMEKWEQACYVAATAAFRDHGEKAKRYARNNQPYEHQTHASQRDVYNRTSATSRYIIRSEVGYRSAPSRHGSHGYWLENPHGTVHAYGNKNRPFGKKYQVIEQACRAPVPDLMNRLRTIYGAGAGVKLSYGTLDLKL